MDGTFPGPLAPPHNARTHSILISSENESLLVPRRFARVYRSRVQHSIAIGELNCSKMHRWRRWCCCCCVEAEEKEWTVPTTSVTEEDYLLPGSEWDPSISTASSRHSTRSHTRQRQGLLRRRNRSRGSSGSSIDGSSNGDYVPPRVPPTPSRTLPTFEEFRLLKTVGKGAFGKVRANLRVATPPALIPNTASHGTLTQLQPMLGIEPPIMKVY